METQNDPVVNAIPSQQYAKLCINGIQFPDTYGALLNETLHYFLLKCSQYIIQAIKGMYFHDIESLRRRREMTFQLIEMLDKTHEVAKTDAKLPEGYLLPEKYRVQIDGVLLCYDYAETVELAVCESVGSSAPAIAQFAQKAVAAFETKPVE